MSSKLRWGKWFWADWENDNALALCSHAAQSVWMRLLCIAAQNEPYGQVMIAGRAPTDGELASLMAPPLRVERFRRLVAELEAHGVAKRKPNGILFCSRMESDLTQFEHQSGKGKKSWESRKNKGLPGARFEPDTQSGSNQSLEAEAEARKKDSPPSPTADALGNGRGEGEKFSPPGRRAEGTNPRALGTNLRVVALNPRATGTNPRSKPKFRNGFAAALWADIQARKEAGDAVIDGDACEDVAAIARDTDGD